VLPLTVAQMKEHLRIEPSFTEEDTYIDACIKAAVNRVDGWHGILRGRCIMEQSWTLTYDRFPCGQDPIRIPLVPLIEITSVKYDDTTGIEQIVAASDYQVDALSLNGWIVPKINFEWPTTFEAIDAVRVLFKAGYGTDPALVPEALLNALKLCTEHHYNRNPNDYPVGIYNLLDPFRNFLSTS
jgi:uncharacterized phiE125 gp8 family phage protein